MKSEEIYNEWKEVKRQIDMPDVFVDGVMDGIYRYEQEKAEQRSFLEVLFEYSIVKTALIATGAAAGFARLVFMIIVILGKGQING